MTITLTGEVERVTFENEETSFRVIKLTVHEGDRTRRGLVAVVGTFSAVGPGTRVRVTGQFVDDPKHGRQFRADSLVPLAPDTLGGVEKYLGSGIIPGIGPGFAKRIVEKFGMQSLTILDEDPGRLSEVSGLGARRVDEIKKGWASKRAISNIMLLLQTHGASPALAMRIYKHYGDRAATVVQRSPYRLALDVRGVGFKTADRIARSLGISGDHPERAQAGVLHELGVLSEQGHVFAPRSALVERAAAMLEIDAGHVEAAIDALWASERVVVEDDGVYLSWLFRAEHDVAQHLARLLDQPARPLSGVGEAIEAFERRSRVTLAPAQRRAVELTAAERVVVITGGPGVGKTTIVRAVLEVFARGRLGIRFAAPTGRAAKRLAEATGREATTIHRLLEFEPRTGRFTKNAGQPLDAGAVIIDEASMIDVTLAAALLAALPDSARFVLVGDADQLPSVGPGAVLRDVLASRNVPSVMLNEIFRQAQQSGIVQNAHRILHGEPPVGGTGDEADADFFIVPRTDPDAAADVVRQLVVTRIPKRFGLDPMREVQVLTPMHRGPAGTIALNQSLQAALNPAGQSVEARGRVYRVGDKVMQTRNDYDREVYNGDLGIVREVDSEDRRLIAEFDGRAVTYDDADLDELVHAYATSVHKSQGSEYPAVVMPLLTTHFVMLSRHLLYTAVTRAKRLCVLVADPKALRLCLAEVRREERLTRLAERLATSLRV